MLAALSGRTALITGGGRGFGATLAKAYAHAGANLFLASRSVGELETIARSLRSMAQPSQRIETFQVDLSCPENASALISARGLSIDILINNAAQQGPIGPLWTQDLGAWRDVLAVDFLAPVALMQVALPQMVKNGWGRIINISGGGATGPRPNFSAYAAAKTALVRVTETLAAEMVGTGVTVNAVAPGVMNTSLLAETRRAGASLAGADEVATAERVACVSGTPGEEAAELCIFLSSDAARSITGRLIAAQWDPWRNFVGLAPAIAAGDVYTLRRVLPQDRGLNWEGQK